MLRKIVQKWGIIQIRTLAKNGGIVQIGGKCSKNKINSKWGILQKCGGICTLGILDFRMGDFKCSPFVGYKFLIYQKVNFEVIPSAPAESDIITESEDERMRLRYTGRRKEQLSSRQSLSRVLVIDFPWI